ncbi:polysaccharide deacetylase family protein [Ruthenibacterium lactatiformans]|uniref:polysaccharide deacetylase family protein n=1 Tax=Ruthenibacterium lactatiformans TaxID=1550024 RepID=UPI002430EAC4|nr:polysaccharide deacetylase family protein [Ruthenibacterium lactatiformans]
MDLFDKLKQVRISKRARRGAVLGLCLCAAAGLGMHLLPGGAPVGCTQEDLADTRAVMAVQASVSGSTDAQSGADADKVVYLTFDDGPSATTESVLDTLKAEGVPATFFVMAADNNEEYLPLLERTVQEGHLIALHTCSHDYKSIYKSPDAYWDDLQKLREKLLPYVPADHEIKWLRFPGGSTNTVSHRYGGSDIMKKLKADAESRGFTYVDWNVCAEDSLGGHPSASTIYNNIIREVGDKNTCVVLMHDTPRKYKRIL